MKEEYFEVLEKMFSSKNLTFLTFIYIINQIITSINFPWYISDSINKFIHPLIKDTGGKKESSLFMSKILNPVLENINVNTIISADVILQMPSINKN
jgi:hypothetical protein